MTNMPTTRQESKKIEKEEEGILSENSEEEVSPGEEEELKSETSEDPNFELPDDLLDMDDDDDLSEVIF